MSEQLPDDQHNSSQPQPVTINNIIPELNRSAGGCFPIVKILTIGCVAIFDLTFILPPLLGIGTAAFVFDRVRDWLTPNLPIASYEDTKTILSGIQTNSQFVSYTVQLAKANITVGIEQRGVLDN